MGDGCVCGGIVSMGLILFMDCPCAAHPAKARGWHCLGPLANYALLLLGQENKYCLGCHRVPIIFFFEICYFMGTLPSSHPSCLGVSCYTECRRLSWSYYNDHLNCDPGPLGQLHGFIPFLHHISCLTDGILTDIIPVSDAALFWAF